MNNKCNSCAKLLTCNRNKCEKISFVEAGILDKPKTIKKNCNGFIDFGISTQEAGRELIKVMQNVSMQMSQ